MQRIRAVQTGRDYLGDLILGLEESPVVTPEFVEGGLASETNIPTNFYPDASLWEGTVTTEHRLPRHHQRCAGLGSTNRLPQSRIIFALVTSRFAF